MSVEQGGISILTGRLRRIAEEALGTSYVLFTLLGASGQALIALEDRVLIIKTGFLAGALGGEKVASFPYDQITSITENVKMTTAFLEIGAAGYDTSRHRDWWSTNPNKDPFQARNCLIIDRFKIAEFRPYIEKIRALCNRSTAVAEKASSPDSPDIMAQLRELSTLYERGLLSEDEFALAKSRILGGKA